MTYLQQQKEIKKVKEKMELLLDCVQDKSICKKHRFEYHKAYNAASIYFLQLSKIKTSNLVIV